MTNAQKEMGAVVVEVILAADLPSHRDTHLQVVSFLFSQGTLDVEFIRTLHVTSTSPVRFSELSVLYSPSLFIFVQ